MKFPPGVPGPTLTRSSFCSFVNMLGAPLRLFQGCQRQCSTMPPAAGKTRGTMAAFESPRPVIIRSKLVLEVASELAGNRGFPQAQARVQLRPQGGEAWDYTIFGSDSPSGIQAVASGEAQIAIVNPSGPLTMAYLGKGAFKEAVPVRAITVIPSRDWMGFAVRESTGITSLADV